MVKILLKKKMHFIIFRRRLRRASGAFFAFSLIFFVFCLLYISFFYTPLEYKQIRLVANQKPNTAGKPTIVDSENLRRRNSEKAMDSIQFLNMHHEVFNTERFGQLNRDNVDFILIVQVHSRIDYLNYLVGSLSRAKGIERVLLIFSYDQNSDPINELIKSIDFCRVTQIFFPFNIQLFPNSYPGRDPSDCPEGIKKSEDLKCANAAYPDTHGNFRLPKLAQIKHHWWWKANYAFDGIMPKYGLEEKALILLEEDHIVAPDFLHSLKLIHKERKRVCPDCELICLGTYPKKFSNYEKDISKLGIEFWYSSKFNMGMAIDRKLWKAVQNCSQFFCSYDDYNWDWTLLQLSVRCLPSKMRVVYTKAPRVLHIGDCGVHTHRCKVDRAAHDALKLFERANSSFFPASMHVLEVGKRMLKPSKPNGGWGDPRDIRLCELNTHPLGVDAAAVLMEAKNALPVTEERNTTKTTEMNYRTYRLLFLLFLPFSPHSLTVFPKISAKQRI
uniref:Alpha-1,6-mannosyl-glycoprotein 2-beta-N-acetylglucosaminyltransferase n=1 Tax=Globodera rostochiensis TaxID=31243 RepID=A0A914HCW3_GLORO